MRVAAEFVTAGPKREARLRADDRPSTPHCSDSKKISNGVSARRAPVRPRVEPAKKEPLMAKMIFINLPVSDLARSTAFYQAIGGEKNSQFSDDTASCMVFSESIYVMLLTH